MQVRLVLLLLASLIAAPFVFLLASRVSGPNANMVPHLRTAENGLSFIETSALDASNVESAFQTILTGASPFSF